MVPNLALKFSYTMVHLFHRKKGGIWFLLDSIQHGEPDLDHRMQKLKRNSIQLGERNLSTIVVLPSNEIRCYNIEAGEKVHKLKPKKLNNYLSQISTEPISESTYDWYLEKGRLNFALIQTNIIENAIKFTEKHSFKPNYVVGLPKSNSHERVAVFDLKSNSRLKSRENLFDATQLEMMAVKLPKSNSNDYQMVY